MTDIPTPPLDLSATIARINRDLAEGSAPARDRWLAPFVVALLTLAAVIGFLAGLMTGFHMIGHS